MANRYPLIVTNSAVSGDTSPYAIKELPSSDTIRLDGTTAANNNKLRVGAASGVTSTILEDANGNEVLDLTTTASAVNHIQFTNSATNNAPIITSVGGDTNVNLRLSPKGTGTIEFGTGSGSVILRTNGSHDLQINPTSGRGSITVPDAANGNISISPNGTGRTLITSTGLGIRDTSAAFDVNLIATSSTALQANRNLTLDVVNAARTLKLGGNIDIAGNLTTANTFTTSGNFALTLTTTAATNVTLPTSGTLATTGGTETLTSKTLTTPAVNGPTFGVLNSATDGDITMDASTTNFLYWTASYTGNRTCTINNFTAGRFVIVMARNTNATARTLTFVAREDAAATTVTPIIAVNGADTTGAALSVAQNDGVCYIIYSPANRVYTGFSSRT